MLAAAEERPRRSGRMLRLAARSDRAADRPHLALRCSSPSPRDTFLSVRNFLNILDQITVLGIMAVGMTFVILIGGIDLSVGSVLALAMMVLGYSQRRCWRADGHRDPAGAACCSP